MAGFFKKEEVHQPNRKRYSCLICGLYRHCRSPKMKATGQGKAKILHIAEAPGEKEDELGIQLIGRSGKFYKKVLNKYGHDLEEGRKINSVNCRPIDNDTSTGDQIAACRKRVFEEAQQFKPKLVFLIGGIAVESWLGLKMKGSFSISKWRKWVIPDHENNCWIIPIYHPAYILRQSDNPAAELIFEEDIERGLSFLNKPLPNPINPNNVKILKHQSLITKYLDRILKIRPELLAFDYETTGLKPDLKRHKIYCVSLCWSKDFAISFSMLNLDSGNMQRFKAILTSNSIGKIAQNMKFEHKWSQKILGVEVRNWKFDPMLYAHIEDNRPGITGLKFQAAIRYGLWDYDSHLESFLKGEGDKGANNFNKIHEIPEDELLQYCGMDSLIEYRLSIEMMGD